MFLNMNVSIHSHIPNFSSKILTNAVTNQAEVKPWHGLKAASFLFKLVYKQTQASCNIDPFASQFVCIIQDVECYHLI